MHVKRIAIEIALVAVLMYRVYMRIYMRNSNSIIHPTFSLCTLSALKVENGPSPASNFLRVYHPFPLNLGLAAEYMSPIKTSTGRGTLWQEDPCQ